MGGLKFRKKNFIEMFYLNSTLNFGILPVMVFQLEDYYMQGLEIGAELCLNPYWLAGEVSWLAVKVFSPC